MNWDEVELLLHAFRGNKPLMLEFTPSARYHAAKWCVTDGDFEGIGPTLQDAARRYAQACDRATKFTPKTRQV